MATPNRDCEAVLVFARTTLTDLYALISARVSPSSTTKEITRAYRQSAVAVHPDKNPDDASAADKFRALQQAYEVLTDTNARAEYDAARAQREARDAAKRSYDQRRREMLDELERGEKSGDAAKQQQQQQQQGATREQILAEEGRRLRRELEAKWKRQRQDREEAEAAAAEAEAAAAQQAQDAQHALRVRWDTNRITQRIDQGILTKRFTRFGALLGITVRDGERKVKFIKTDKRRRTVGTAIVVFAAAASAHIAVQHWLAARASSDADWSDWLVEWASGEEPANLVKSETLGDDEMTAFEAFETSVLDSITAHQKARIAVT